MSDAGPSIEGVADQVIADDIVPGRPGKDDTAVVLLDGPRLGCALWFLLAVIALIVGLLVGTSGGTSEVTEPVTTHEIVSTTTSPPPTTTTTPPTSSTVQRPAVTSITTGWDHPPFATNYTNANTGQPVQGLSVILACMKVTGVVPNAIVTVTWTGGGGTVTGTGRVNANGQVVVAGGINSATTYTIQGVTTTSPSNPTAQSTLPFPSTPPTNVTLPNDQLCTP